jgi:hypothetical protein
MNDAQLELHALDDYDTWPRDDPHQAMLEAGLREAHGAFEIVRDPLGRIA